MFGYILVILLIIIANAIFWIKVKRGMPYMVGKIVVMGEEGGKLIYSLELDCDPAELQHMKNVMFEIDSQV